MVGVMDHCVPHVMCTLNKSTNAAFLYCIGNQLPGYSVLHNISCQSWNIYFPFQWVLDLFYISLDLCSCTARERELLLRGRMELKERIQWGEVKFPFTPIQMYLLEIFRSPPCRAVWGTRSFWRSPPWGSERTWRGWSPPAGRSRSSPGRSWRAEQTCEPCLM